ncbi:hypothetical protein ERICII_02591 [Paenibacillus larvae subsp. larvae DSM 25430]|nr:hypothetical protein ERICII_02591 [Paenibacillus larvae subsp. larvae DSM 25430]
MFKYKRVHDFSYLVLYQQETLTVFKAVQLFL